MLVLLLSSLFQTSDDDGYQNGVTNWLAGRANANNVDLNRNFPDLNKIYYKIYDYPNHPNNHIDEHFEVMKLLEQVIFSQINYSLSKKYNYIHHYL